ncbi:MAG: hypothetical protein ACXAC7_12560 [Candidatus Hodarchaeales archaeon]|jgi:hypothetical protein
MKRKNTKLLQEILDILETQGHTKYSKSLDSFLTKTFGLLVTFLENELSAQQKRIWFELASCYPKTLTGLEIADRIGSSKISKGIYKSIRALEERDLITLHQKHKKSYAINANENHVLTALLIEFIEMYGTRL